MFTPTEQVPGQVSTSGNMVVNPAPIPNTNTFGQNILQNYDKISNKIKIESPKIKKKIDMIRNQVPQGLEMYDKYRNDLQQQSPELVNMLDKKRSQLPDVLDKYSSQYERQAPQAFESILEPQNRVGGIKHRTRKHAKTHRKYAKSHSRKSTKSRARKSTKSRARKH